jgi:hypothetical protein
MITAIALGLALSLSAAEMPESAVPADDGKPAATEVVEAKAVQVKVVEQTRAPEASIIQEVERSEVNRDAMDRQMAPRGSFWWVVGALVIAGIILYVLVG